MTERSIRLVDTETGELVEGGCPQCDLERTDRENVEGELRKALRREKALRADREKDAKLHPRRQEVEEVFAYWQEQCRHPGAKLDADRTYLIVAMLDSYDKAMCLRAIDGAAFDPFVTRRKNKTAKRHDGIGLIFKNAEKFEEFCNRAPLALAA